VKEGVNTSPKISELVAPPPHPTLGLNEARTRSIQSCGEWYRVLYSLYIDHLTLLLSSLEYSSSSSEIDHSPEADTDRDETKPKANHPDSDNINRTKPIKRQRMVVEVVVPTLKVLRDQTMSSPHKIEGESEPHSGYRHWYSSSRLNSP
jgi:hypothetical protein